MASSLDLQRFERQFRDRELAFTGGPRDRYERRVEMESVLARLRPRPGERILDAGCGVGRLSSHLLQRGAQVWALDFAHRRLQFLRDQAPAQAYNRRLHLLQGDVTCLPFAPASFDAIACMQVLEHIPEADARRALLTRFAQLLRPGGRLVLTVYNYHLPWQRRRQAKEGRHETGVFYHCYTAQELESELLAFPQVSVCGILNLLPHTYRLFPRLGPLGRACDHACEPLPLSRRWGHLLLAFARA